MLVSCRSSKGGSGTSVVATGLAACARHHSSVPTPDILLVDLAGDIPALLGLSDPTIGLSEWLAQPATFDFDELLVRVADDMHVLPRGHAHLPESSSGTWAKVRTQLIQQSTRRSAVVIDTGHRQLPSALDDIVDLDLLVIRPCYLALRRATLDAHDVDGVVLIEEAGRVLTARDVQSVLGRPVVAQIPFDADIGRRVDAGVLLSRPPRSLIGPLAPLVSPDRSQPSNPRR